MTTIVTGTIPRSQRPGVQAFFGEYDKHPEYHAEMFDMGKSSLGYELETLVSGSGLATQKPEGTPTQMDSITQGYEYKYLNLAYGIQFKITREAVDDGKYLALMEKVIKEGTLSMSTTKEVVAASVYNRAFNSNYTFGDGSELITTTHTTKAGNQSNTLAAQADFSEAALEDMVIKINKVQNDAGNEVALRAQKLIGPSELEFEFCRVLKSVQQNDTANNAVNALREMGSIPKGYVCSPFLTDADAWFLRTNAADGMKGFNRIGREFKKDSAFTEEAGLYKFYERYSFGASDWRGIFGSSGA